MLIRIIISSILFKSLTIPLRLINDPVKNNDHHEHPVEYHEYSNIQIFILTLFVTISTFIMTIPRTPYLPFS